MWRSNCQALQEQIGTPHVPDDFRDTNLDVQENNRDNSTGTRLWHVALHCAVVGAGAKYVSPRTVGAGVNAGCLPPSASKLGADCALGAVGSGGPYPCVAGVEQPARRSASHASSCVIKSLHLGVEIGNCFQKRLELGDDSFTTRIPKMAVRILLRVTEEQAQGEQKHVTSVHAHCGFLHKSKSEGTCGPRCARSGCRLSSPVSVRPCESLW